MFYSQQIFIAFFVILSTAMSGGVSAQPFPLVLRPRGLDVRTYSEEVKRTPVAEANYSLRSVSVGGLSASRRYVGGESL